MEDIRQLILTNKKPSYQTTNKKEVRIRCPYCGDSKDPSSAHLYIEMAPPYKFHCKKCETAGVLSNQVLRDFGIFSNGLSGAILRNNREFKSNGGIQKITYKKINLNNPVVDSASSKNALNYFNSRFNLSLDNEYLVGKFKVITDSLEFFNVNKITPPKFSFDFSKAIGFISSDNSHIIFRDISGYQSLRYFNLNLNQSEFDNKMYTIKTKVDIMSTETTLVITEGIFDIIGVYEHFYKEKPGNYIFAAACGKGFNNIILNFIRKGFLNLNVEIYSDADVDISFYKRLKSQSEYLKNIKFTIYYNALYNPSTKFAKDYGIPKEHIQLKKVFM